MTRQELKEARRRAALTKNIGLAHTLSKARSAWRDEKHRYTTRGLDMPREDEVTSLNAALDVREAFYCARDAFAKTKGRADRDEAEQLEGYGMRLAGQAALSGGGYSGDVVIDTGLADVAAASTSISKGEQYSRSCTYKKNDAVHSTRVAIAGIPYLHQNSGLAEASRREGLPLLDLRADGSAAWARVKGKALFLQRGWVVYDAATQFCFHSTKSRKAAQAGLAKKVTDFGVRQAGICIPESELVRVAEQKLPATFRDARRLGFCLPGIRAFQEKFGIGDKTDTAVLLASGNPDARRLALHLAAQHLAGQARAG